MKTIQGKSFYIKYNLFKDGSPVVDGFNTENERKLAIQKKQKEGYSPIKIGSSEKEISYHLGIK